LEKVGNGDRSLRDDGQNPDAPQHDSDECFISMPADSCVLQFPASDPAGFRPSYSALANKIFPPDIINSNAPVASLEVCKRAILCPKNEDALRINEEILQNVNGEPHSFFSIDTVDCDPGEHVGDYPLEFLHSMTPSGLPPHRFNVKHGSMVMLLRNLDVRRGLCNGLRLIVRRTHDYVLECEVAMGQHCGTRVFIPRLSLTPSADAHLPYKLRRRQFPLRLSFAMTINKSQGQTFDYVGVFLRQPVFCHGQLYVALSRVRSERALTIALTQHDSNSEDPAAPRQQPKVLNIVYREALRVA
jgi:hypothetical protein